MNLGTTISKLRKLREIRQEDLAISCGITPAYLSQIENNKKDPKLDKLKIIAEKLNVPLPVIFFLSLDLKDVPEEKQQFYNAINPSIQKLIEDVFSIETF